jgi:vacuolar-type H+-ATPase subunit I/STV1
MPAVFNDEVTSFFSNADSFRRLTTGQYITLSNRQDQIDALNAQELSDFELANRDIQVQNLRQEMVAIVTAAKTQAPRPDLVLTTADDAAAPRHLRNTEK